MVSNRKDFDVVIYSEKNIPISIIREFEELPLKIGLYVNESTVDKTILIKLEQQPKENIESITEKTKLILNLSEYTYINISTVINACIKTDTNYIDCCTNLEILKTVFKEYSTVNNIKIIQGCSYVPFLIDLGVFSIGKIHEIKNIECVLIYPLKLKNDFELSRKMITENKLGLNSIIYNFDIQSYLMS